MSLKIYLASISTSEYAIERKAYSNIGSSLKYIYDNLKEKALSIECINGCDFFDREYVKNYFTEEFFYQFINNDKKLTCRSSYGEFFIERINDSKYQFVFAPPPICPQNQFIVCELDLLDLIV